jgi:hypothetical protein
MSNLKFKPEWIIKRELIFQLPLSSEAALCKEHCHSAREGARGVERHAPPRILHRDRRRLRWWRPGSRSELSCPSSAWVRRWKCVTSRRRRRTLGSCIILGASFVSSKPLSTETACGSGGRREKQTILRGYGCRPWRWEELHTHPNTVYEMYMSFWVSKLHTIVGDSLISHFAFSSPFILSRFTYGLHRTISLKR